MPAMNLATKLPPAPLLLPGAALTLASLVLVASVLVQGRALRESALTDAPPASVNSSDHDAPLPAIAPNANLGLLANSALFGRYDPTAAPVSEEEAAASKPSAAVLGDQAPETLPEATLALKLQGIVYKQDPAQRRAIIAGEGPNAAARQIGESLLGDAVIRFIERRRVVIEQQGELKALTLTEPSLAGSGAAQAPAIPMMPGGPPQSLQIDGAPQAPVYETPQPEYEPPPEELDNEAQYEDPMQADENVEFEDSQPAE